ncbi:AAA family ATPase [Algiphilus sp.]|uniref:AAA family ATPase n=1 Tax=Algiphilus sp. TaxID=1872431 RepID=UPI0025BB6756|nr:MoxR family ATPase [Algiphilus sp.]MCK5771614.1 MoxR family ATPase [Algiphilus sp.]
MHQQAERALAAIDTIILGKAEQTRLAFCCLLAGGHLLIEDLPGVGKTTLALAMSHLLGLEYRRVQFTSDLLPADILGVSIFDSTSGAFRFEAGPIFTEILLADEINRASPKTQSALLEAMAERQVTVEGATRTLPDPFFVIATQNPRDQLGTYPLPESQLDRFLMRLSLGYPPAEAEQRLLLDPDHRDLLGTQEAVLDRDSIRAMQRNARAVHVAPAAADYILALVQHTREAPGLRHGLSPRAGLAVRRAAQAWALLDRRDGVLPEDIQRVFAAVAGHRLHARAESEAPAPTPADILAAVAVP